MPDLACAGYILGGLMWFAIPFGFATSLGLAVRGMDLPLTVTEAGDGGVVSHCLEICSTFFLPSLHAQDTWLVIFVPDLVI